MYQNRCHLRVEEVIEREGYLCELFVVEQSSTKERSQF